MVELSKTLKVEFIEYCKLNEVELVDEFIVKCAKDGLTLDKYGVARTHVGRVKKFKRKISRKRNNN